MFKVKFYAKKKNLQSLKTKDLSERKGTTCIQMSNDSKMYEHVGMAVDHHRRRSDAWQITSYVDHNHINKEQRTMNDFERRLKL